MHVMRAAAMLSVAERSEHELGLSHSRVRGIVGQNAADLEGIQDNCCMLLNITKLFLIDICGFSLLLSFSLIFQIMQKEKILLNQSAAYAQTKAAKTTTTKETQCLPNNLNEAQIDPLGTE